LTGFAITSRHYQQRGSKTVRKAIQTTLRQQSRRNKRTVWEYADGTWRLDKAVLAGPNAEETTEAHAERQTYTKSVLVPSSVGGQTSDGTSELHEGVPQSELEQSRKGDNETDQDVQPAAFLQTEPESRSTSIDSEPQAPAPEMHINVGNKTKQLPAATLRARTSDDQASDNEDTPTHQSEPPVESTSTIHNDKPSGIEEAQVSVDSCNGPEQNGEDEPDFGAIVRELRRIKQERYMQEQRIKAGHDSLPDVSVLTQSVGEAQRVANEAQRAADEAQRVAEVANKALEEALAKQRQIFAAELDLETLIRDSELLRSKLDID
jgi:hypothetical protein